MMSIEDLNKCFSDESQHNCKHLNKKDTSESSIKRLSIQTLPNCVKLQNDSIPQIRRQEVLFVPSLLDSQTRSDSTSPKMVHC